jgi:thioredoxin reductase (NADPH)
VDGRAVRAVAVILALGGTARKLNVPGEAEYLGTGVSYCATCDGFFFRDKTVVVVGGGDTAVEEALYLSRLVRKVFLLHRRDTFRASMILQNRVFAESAIEVLWNTIVTEIKGDGKAVNAVSIENTVTGERRELPADGVFIFVGFFPNNRLVPPEIRVNGLGFVLTDEKCETNVPGIFVAGDLRQKFANQIVIAASDGAIAALAAAHHVEAAKNGRNHT